MPFRYETKSGIREKVECPKEAAHFKHVDWDNLAMGCCPSCGEELLLSIHATMKDVVVCDNCQFDYYSPLSYAELANAPHSSKFVFLPPNIKVEKDYDAGTVVSVISLYDLVSEMVKANPSFVEQCIVSALDGQR